MNIALIRESIKKNLLLHMVVESEVNQTPFGQITFNVEVVDGVAQISTMNCVKNVRRKYDGTRQAV